jgi:uncharacterized protein (TIGR02466 family)
MNNIKQTGIEGIFPTPVSFYNFERKFTKEEDKFFKEQSKDCVKNDGNFTTKNNYILDCDEMKSIKENMLECVGDFLYNILCVDKEKVKPYITQSWLNYTTEGQYHHQHRHQNSLISGVFYVDTCEEDKIKFFDTSFKQIKIESLNYNLFNSLSWWFPTKKYTVLLFPSHLSHMVEMKKESNTRISLAFNTFISGTIGSNLQLSELKL